MLRRAKFSVFRCSHLWIGLMEHIKNNPIVLPSVGAFITGFLTAYFWFKVFSPKRAVPTTNIPTNTSTTNVAEKSEPVNTREYDSESDSEDSEDIPPHKMVRSSHPSLQSHSYKFLCNLDHESLIYILHLDYL